KTMQKVCLCWNLGSSRSSESRPPGSGATRQASCRDHGLVQNECARGDILCRGGGTALHSNLHSNPVGAVPACRAEAGRAFEEEFWQSLLLPLHKERAVGGVG